MAPDSDPVSPDTSPPRQPAAGNAQPLPLQHSALSTRRTERSMAQGAGAGGALPQLVLFASAPPATSHAALRSAIHGLDPAAVLRLDLLASGGAFAAHFSTAAALDQACGCIVRSGKVRRPHMTLLCVMLLISLQCDAAALLASALRLPCASRWLRFVWIDWHAAMRVPRLHTTARASRLPQPACRLAASP